MGSCRPWLDLEGSAIQRVLIKKRVVESKITNLTEKKSEVRLVHIKIEENKGKKRSFGNSFQKKAEINTAD